MVQSIRTLTGALAAFMLAACATQPASVDQGATVYYDPGTGEFSAPGTATEDEKSLAALLNEFQQSEATPPEPELSDAEIWKTDGAGNQTHIQSGLLCPVKWSDLSRGSSHIYKRSGQDVGCNYTDSFGSLVTFYAYRNSAPVAAEVEEIMEHIVRSRYPVHEPLKIPILSEVTYRGNFASDAIRFTDANGTGMISGVATNEFAGWRLKFRFTFPEAEMDRIERFLLASIMGQQDSLLSVAKAAEAALERDDSI